jgi:hypothetical protein
VRFQSHNKRFLAEGPLDSLRNRQGVDPRDAQGIFCPFAVVARRDKGSLVHPLGSSKTGEFKMKMDNISKEHLTAVEFKCPITGISINFTFDLLECKTQIIQGKFASAQIGVQCEACGKFHLSDLIPTGFLVLRQTTCERSDV